ncbi:tyrosine-protein phosphatase [Cryptosporangium minutisporangium]|uniref:Tyrosine-protein phosphatase n=1 Tax=Cryptosporangium minutisporangium TaxID=113569 RepID=A0ABP6SUT8_9ACTN
MDSGTERVVRLEGASNVRDLGGLTTTDGRRTRFGLLYRADAPTELTPDDVHLLVTERGLRQIVDLRSAEEVDRDGPGPLQKAGVATANHSISSDPGVGQVVPEILRGNLSGHYLGYLGSGAHRVVAAARLLADPERQPALVHCAAGKDRTGTLVAILLDAAGVRRDEIVADYALTDANMDAVVERVVRRLTAASGGVLPPSANSLPDEARRARPETMAEFLDQLTTVFGGGAGWLLAHGFADADLARFREALLED